MTSPTETPPVTTPLSPRVPPWVAPLAIVVGCFALQWLSHALTSRLAGWSYYENVALDTGFAVVMAVSLNIVNGYTGQFSIGHAAFYAIGGYAAAAITFYGSVYLYGSPETLADAAIATRAIMFLTALLVGGGVAAAAGWVVGLPSLRLKGDYLAIVTLGFGEIVRILLQQTNAQLFSRRELHDATVGRLLPPPLGGALGFINTPKLTDVFWTGLWVGLTILVAWRLKKSTFGRGMIAVRENEIAAESMGVNVTRLKVWAFVIGAFFAGVAGGLYAHKLGTTIGPKDAGFVESFNYVIMVVLGGLGSISGAALAAVLFVVAQQWLLEPTHVWHVGLGVLAVRLIVWPGGSTLRTVVQAVPVVLALLAYAAAEIVQFVLPLPVIGGEVDPNAFWLVAAFVALVAFPPGGWTGDRVRAAAWGVGLVVLVEGLRGLAARYGVKLGDYRIILFALVLIAVMIQRPGGLFGTHEITDLARMRRRSGTGADA